MFDEVQLSDKEEHLFLKSLNFKDRTKNGKQHQKSALLLVKC